MKKLTYIFVLVMVMAGGRAFGQNSFTYLQYAPSLPVGEVTDFTGNFQWRGFGFGASWFLQDAVTIGFETGWYVFRDETDGAVSEVIESDNSTITITAKQFKFINSVPVLATARYYMEGSQVWGYVQMGIGGYYNEKRLELGLRTVTEDAFQFGIAPEIGIVIPTYSESSFTMGVQYNQAFATSNFDGVGYVAFKIGVGWGL